MRIANRKRFMFSCIFFTFVLLIFGKSVVLLKEGKLSKGLSSPIVMATEKNKVPISSEGSEKNKDANKKYVVVLDAGHGGIDFGTSYKNLNEKDITFKIVKYAEEYLKDEGYTVVLTRNEDKLVPLKEIGNIANEAKADAFISIHINSLDDINYKGITAYYYDGKGYQKDERTKLSKTIEDEIMKSDNWENKGVKRENFAVLRYTKMPSTLVECGFITNEEDRGKLIKDEVLKRLAKNISNGIIKYLDENDKNGYTGNDEDYTKYMGEGKANKDNTNKKSTTNQNESKDDNKSSTEANKKINKTIDKPISKDTNKIKDMQGKNKGEKQ